MTAPAIAAVVFDIGGVLLHWDPRAFYRTLIEDEDALDYFLAEICTMEWNATLDAGRSFDEACAELAGEHPDHAELIHAWKRQDEMVRGEIPGVAAVVDELVARSIPLYLLTNMPSDVFAARRAAYPVLGRFAGAVVSGDERVLKPSREIFDVVTRRFGLEPPTTLFIDDNEPNVAGARAAGFVAHHFVDAPTLEHDLRRLRLLDG